MKLLVGMLKFEFISVYINEKLMSDNDSVTVIQT
jgi:hypothetical protein